MRFRIVRKEAKEARLGVRRVNTAESPVLGQQRAVLLQEATELKLILTAFIKKLETLGPH